MNPLNIRKSFADVVGLEVESASREWITLRIAPDLDLKLRVVTFFRTEAFSDLPNELCERLCVALDELLANAIEHGCREQKTGVQLTYIRTEKAILWQLRDAGPGFSWGELSHSAVSNPHENPLLHVEYRAKMGLRPGGYGIMLVKQIADDLIYNEQGNEVLFLKYIA